MTSGQLSRLAAATPATRDRYVDFLRAASILVVIVGHWLIALIAWNHGVIRSTSAIGRAPGLWLATWFLQVMPVFFFVGGYANAVSLLSSQHRGEKASAFIFRRMRRLLVPFVPFLGAWASVQVVLHLEGIGASTGPTIWGVSLLRGVRPPGQTIPFGPLWFLGFYLGVVALAPFTHRLHERARWWAPGAMMAGAVVCDIVGFAGGHPGARRLNIAFVLLFPHQLGYFWADGTLTRWPIRRLLGAAAAGLAALVVLTNSLVFLPFGDRRFEWFPAIGHYPRSILGTDVERISNAYPPTLVFLAASVWMIALVLLLRRPLTAWLQRPVPWMTTIAVNARIMTLFLWHMTAYLVAILVMWPLGFGRQPAPTMRWWWERPLWIAVPGLALAALVLVFGPLEQRTHHRALFPDVRP